MKRVCEAPRCVEEFTPHRTGPTHRYCKPACRAAASRARRKAGEAKDGDPAHGHRVTLDAEASGYTGGAWRSVWGCRDCPMEMVGPLEVERLEDVECDSEAGQGRAA